MTDHRPALIAMSDRAIAETVVRRAREQSTKPMATEESIRKGQAYVARMNEDADRALRQRIADGELIASKALQQRAGITRQSISRAMKEGRLFAIVGPAGTAYYPAFYADPKCDRYLIERVAKQLGDLPATVKFHFFTSKAFSLNSKTPLAALEEGRLDDVLRAATACVER